MADDGEAPAILRDLTSAERDLCARFPLPPGVADAVVNKTLLCDALDVSPTTLSAWIRAGLPFESAGTNGRSYEFRLSLAFAWAADRKAREDASRRTAEGAAAQLRLALLGEESAGAEDRARLSPREQRDLIDVERAYMAAAEARRDLIRRRDVAVAIGEVWSGLRDRLDALPDMIARRLDLSGEAIEAIEAECDGLLAEAVEIVRGIIGHDGEEGETL